MPGNYSSFSHKLRGHANGLGEVESKRPVSLHAIESPGSTVPCAVDFRDWNCGWVSRIEAHNPSAISIQHGQVVECHYEVVLEDVGYLDKVVRAGLT